MLVARAVYLQKHIILIYILSLVFFQYFTWFSDCTHTNLCSIAKVFRNWPQVALTGILKFLKILKTVFLVSRNAEVLQGAQSSWNRFQSHGTTFP